MVSKQKVNRRIIIPIAIGVAVAALTFWAIMTKVGAIPNYLNIEILCPGEPSSDEYPFPSSGDETRMDKPVIYLYPTVVTDVNVNLNYKGKIIADYPEYDNSIKGWNVTAYPDGKIIDKADGKEYSYLFWEGRPTEKINWDLSTGFVVKGSDTRQFLQQKLSEIGLMPKEYNEFIVYWYPILKDNAYNLVHFAGSQYTDTAELTVAPEPDSLLRVFMVYKPLDEKVSIKEQSMKPFVRKGFTVVEWGGTKA